MNGDYVDGTIFQDTDIYFFDDDIYDGDYDFIIDSCVIHTSTHQTHEQTLLSYKRVQI